jgi:hypothetical protein
LLMALQAVELGDPGAHTQQQPVTSEHGNQAAALQP